MAHHYWSVFAELIRAPFSQPELIWGIVPLYFGWVLNELTSSKASYKTAIQTGFGFLWAGAHWTYQALAAHSDSTPRRLGLEGLLAVNAIVTMLALVLGVTALVCGLRRRFPRYGSFLGHTRFSNYFMIAMFPIQSQHLAWSWDRLIAIVLFAVPIWFVTHVGLMPLRR